MLKYEFWCILGTKFNTFINGLVPETHTKKIFEPCLGGLTRKTLPLEYGPGIGEQWDGEL